MPAEQQPNPEIPRQALSPRYLAHLASGEMDATKTPSLSQPATEVNNRVYQAFGKKWDSKRQEDIEKVKHLSRTDQMKKWADVEAQRIQKLSQKPEAKAVFAKLGFQETDFANPSALSHRLQAEFYNKYCNSKNSAEDLKTLAADLGNIESVQHAHEFLRVLLGSDAAVTALKDVITAQNELHSTPLTPDELTKHHDFAQGEQERLAFFRENPPQPQAPKPQQPEQQPQVSAEEDALEKALSAYQTPILGQLPKDPETQGLATIYLNQRYLIHHPEILDTVNKINKEHGQPPISPDQLAPNLQEYQRELESRLKEPNLPAEQVQFMRKFLAVMSQVEAVIATQRSQKQKPPEPATPPQPGEKERTNIDQIQIEHAIVRLEQPLPGVPYPRFVADINFTPSEVEQIRVLRKIVKDSIEINPAFQALNKKLLEFQTDPQLQLLIQMHGKVLENPNITEPTVRLDPTGKAIGIELPPEMYDLWVTSGSLGDASTGFIDQYDPTRRDNHNPGYGKPVERLAPNLRQLLKYYKAHIQSSSPTEATAPAEKPKQTEQSTPLQQQFQQIGEKIKHGDIQGLQGVDRNLLVASLQTLVGRIEVGQHFPLIQQIHRAETTNAKIIPDEKLEGSSTQSAPDGLHVSPAMYRAYHIWNFSRQLYEHMNQMTPEHQAKAAGESAGKAMNLWSQLAEVAGEAWQHIEEAAPEAIAEA